jgi:transposase
MERIDARTLSSSAQEHLRRRVVRAVEGGMKKSEAARLFEVSYYSVRKWVKAVKVGGDKAIKAKPKGRPKRSGKLKPWQTAQIVWTITHQCPDDVGLPFTLWNRNAIRQLIKQRFGLELSLSSMSRLLKGWGFTAQKPVYKAIEKDPQKVKTWLHQDYPAIKARAKEENAEIHWGDEMGVRSDHTCGRSFGRKGQTPVVKKSAKRYRCNMISSIAQSGAMRFMIYQETLTASLFIAFLRRLIHTQQRKIFLVVDNLKVHHAKKVQTWIDGHKDRIELFFLPPYAPELNPDELLNHDVKASACHNQLISTERQLKSSLRSYLHRLQKTPKKIQNFFQKKSVQYAA